MIAAQVPPWVTFPIFSIGGLVDGQALLFCQICLENGSTMECLEAEVLVVGGGTGGTAAAIQAARRGAQVTLVSEFGWLGGMLTSAGVPVPDGNELRPWQTGLWGAFIAELYQRQPGGLDHSWVSCFSYEPKVGAQIFADWVAALSNLHWISGQVPQAVKRDGDRITAVEFERCSITAQIIVDATELGDLLALGDVPHRWGWEAQELWQEPSAPAQVDLDADPFYQRYPVQSPTWVVMLRDYGAGAEAPLISAPDFKAMGDLDLAFAGAGDRFGPERLLSYGQLPPDGTGQPSYMINWPIKGNDYGYGLERLRGSEEAWQEWAREAIAYSQGFAHYLQQEYGRRYGLDTDCFPQTSADQGIGGGAFALHPYYREGRRGIGLATVIEQDLLPQAGGQVAWLPRDSAGNVTAIALGNYPNDHHYPEREIKLAPKARRWGGRWSGTPFTIPYGALVPGSLDGLLFCDKNISISHMANGATRLQPTVLGTGQAVGMAAALCVEQGCQPRELAVRDVQEALIEEPTAPSAVVPLYNLSPNHPEWRSLQRFYLDHPEQYPSDGEYPGLELSQLEPEGFAENFRHSGKICLADDNEGYRLSHPEFAEGLPLITLRPEVEQGMRSLQLGNIVEVSGTINPAGPWLRLITLKLLSRA